MLQCTVLSRVRACNTRVGRCLQRRRAIQSQSVSHILSDTQAGQSVKAQGWVKTVRKQKQNAFVEVNDGSSFENLQVVLPATEVEGYVHRATMIEVRVSFVSELMDNSGITDWS